MNYQLFTDFRGTKNFTSLDGLRFFSIMPVIFHHSLLNGDNYPNFLELGFLGVDFFFVISGFLITTLLLRERNKTHHISLKKFYMRRTLRIFPLYYGVILAYSILYWLVLRDSTSGQQFLSEIWIYLTYLANFFPVTFVIVWSLAAEEQFYLIWPTIEKYLENWVIPILIVLLLINQLLNFPQGRQWLHEVWEITVPSLSIMEITFTPILLGVAIAHALNNKIAFSVIAPITANKWMPLVYLLLLVLIITNAPEDIAGLPRLSIQFAMTMMLISCVIRQDHFLEPLLTLKLIKHIGSISYGMYLLHIVCISIVVYSLNKINLGNDFLVFLLGSALTILIASLSFRYYEKPFLKMKKYFSVLDPESINNSKNIPGTLNAETHKNTDIKQS